jgi:hypothetical protein
MTKRSEDAPAPPPASPPPDDSPFPPPPLDPQGTASTLPIGSDAATEEMLHREVDPEESPFALPPIEGLPFDRDSDEALAIRRVIEEADRERARADAPAKTPPSMA